MYLGYIMFQIHHLFNESKKSKVVYKYDRRKYLSKGENNE
jgi:hypothetical protein